MRRSAQHHFHIPLTASVRMRLTLWYLAMMAFIVCLFGGSLYVSQVAFNADAAESKVEAQLYQDSQQFAQIYRQALLKQQATTTLALRQSSQEMVLLLRPDGSVLDARGPLTSSLIKQLQSGAGKSMGMSDLTVSQRHSHNWWHQDTVYRILALPVLNQNTRIAVLMVGLLRQNYALPLGIIWFFHGMLALLIAALGGYWLAGRALRPVKMITRTANEINATDLRRRLNLQRRDEFGELAATFDQMLSRLDAAFKRQTQFTADASHELRTPLTIIDLEINRALTQLHKPEEYRQALEVIQTENEQMSSVVNSLLLLARADTGQISLHLQEIDLSDIALACVERLLPLAQKSCIALSTGDLPELPVSGDQHYLSRMMMNLIENAIKYTSSVGTRVRVELAEKQDKWGVFRVQDDGPGIAEEHLPYLFDRFYRVDKARSHNKQEVSRKADETEEAKGTGLGLSIVQWIVQAHHGEVRVESKMGAGSLFEVKLPLLKQADAKEE
jgi:signal transduction histidine kinase